VPGVLKLKIMEELQITTPETIEDLYINFNSLTTGQLFYFNDFPNCYCVVNTVKDNTIYFNGYDLDNGERVGNNFGQPIKESLQTAIVLINDTSIVEIYNSYKKLINKIETFQTTTYDDYNLRRDKINNFKSLGDIKSLEDVIKHHFTSDNYEITNDGEFLNIVLKYNNITMTNSESCSHFIKSIFVKLVFNKNTKRFNSLIEGVRGDLSVKELNSGYVHSHLRSGTNGWTVFCLGSSEIAGIITDLNIHEFNDAKFDLLLYNLEEYIKWESLEGGPYFRISNLNYGERMRETVFSDQEVTEIYEDFVSEQQPFNTTFDVSLKKIKVVNDDLFIKHLSDICPESAKGKYINGTFVKNLNYDEILRKAKSVFQDKNNFKFKNETYPKMYIEDSLKDATTELVPQKTIVNKVIEKLESHINNHFLQKLL
jgi:hypothetical protein